MSSYRITVEWGIGRVKTLWKSITNKVNHLPLGMTSCSLVASSRHPRFYYTISQVRGESKDCVECSAEAFYWAGMGFEFLT